MKREGFSGGSRNNAKACVMPGGNTELNSSDDTLQLMSGEPELLNGRLYVNSAIAATRQHDNQLLMSWNSKGKSNFGSMYRIWRILSKNNPESTNYGSDWNQDSEPSSIISGLGNHEAKIINVAEGDLYYEWVDAPTYNQYYVIYLFIYKNSDGVYSSEYSYPPIDPKQIQDYCRNVTPSLSYDQNTNSFTIGKCGMTGRRILEFCRTDRNPGYPTNISDEKTLHEMMLITTLNEERSGDQIYRAYYDANDPAEGYALWPFKKGEYKVGVTAYGGLTGNNLKISIAINNAIVWLNSVLEDYGVRLQRVDEDSISYNISIDIGPEDQLFAEELGNNPNYIYGGKWQTVIDGDYTKSAYIKLANDFHEYAPFCPYETIVLEELTQAIINGWDQYEYSQDTLHYDFNYYNKSINPRTKETELTAKDQNILRLIYSGIAPAGSNSTAVSKALNIPKGVYRCSTDDSDTVRKVSANFLDGGATYQVRAFVVNSFGRISETSDWLTGVKTPKNLRPDPWEWQSTVAAGYAVPFSNNAFHPLTAAEWNAFTERINEFREYKGFPAYDFTTVSPGTVFTADIYNEAVDAIKGITGYGEWLSRATAGQTNALSAHLYTSLRDGLNAIQ